MVASISARKSVGAAVAYFKHMARDEYYTGDHKADGEWDGRGTERLALEGHVSKADFEALLNGLDPKTGEPLAQLGKTHAPGWDITYSAPKSVSVMWALSPETDRAKIEAAHRAAVHAATTHLEDHHAITRRGKGGATREPVAGLTIARFHHHTSRDLDPQLHTHALIFNTAPRRDGTWGTLVSKELYKAQKETGAIYRAHLANALEREGYVVDRQGTGFRLKAIPKNIEWNFSKRRQSIQQAAEKFGYKTPKGMELAALRTRQAKRPRERAALFKAWKQEARALGFDLHKARTTLARTSSQQLSKQAPTNSPASAKPASQVSIPTRQLIKQAVTALRGTDRMAGIQANLRQPKKQREPEAER